MGVSSRLIKGVRCMYFTEFIRFCKEPVMALDAWRQTIGHVHQMIELLSRRLAMQH